MKVLHIHEGGYRSSENEDYYVHWDGFERKSSAISLKRIIDKNGEAFRSEYFKMIYDLGIKTGIKNFATIDHGLSYWYFFKIHEKSPTKSESIKNYFKIRALELIVEELNVDRLVLHIRDGKIRKLVDSFCKDLRIEFIYKTEDTEDYFERTKIKTYYRLKATYLLFNKIKKYLLSKKHGNPKSMHENPISIITYFPNVDSSKLKNNEFYSNYWMGLHELIKENNISVNWFWYYSESPEATFADTINIKNKLKDTPNQNFYLLDEFLDLRSILRIIKEYIGMNFKLSQILRKCQKIYSKASRVNYYFVYEDDIKESICGGYAINNLWAYYVFKNICKVIKNQKKAIYLWEGQQWEKYLAYNWHQYNDSPIYGVQHSTLRYFDLRSFESPETYKDEDYQALMPDLLIINGENSLKLLRETGFPQNRLMMAEALRYQYLKNVSATKKKVENNIYNGFYLLAIMCHSWEYNQEAVRILKEMLQNCENNDNIKIVIKPHPDIDIDQNLKKAGLYDKVEVSNRPIRELMNCVDRVFCTHLTSAVFDAVLFGLPVVMQDSLDLINLSPVYGLEEIPFVDNGNDLYEKLKDGRPIDLKLADKIFFFGDNFEVWRKILNESNG